MHELHARSANIAHLPKFWFNKFCVFCYSELTHSHLTYHFALARKVNMPYHLGLACTLYILVTGQIPTEFAITKPDINMAEGSERNY
jgi:hypothetical protein